MIAIYQCIFVLSFPFISFKFYYYNNGPQYTCNDASKLLTVLLSSPPGSHFEAWSKPNYQHGRMHRQYSSPCGNGLRSPNPDYWSAGPNVAGFQRPWQSSPDHPAVQEASVPTSSGLRPTAEPWPPMARNGQSDNTSVTSAEEEPSLYIPGVSGIS